MLIFCEWNSCQGVSISTAIHEQQKTLWSPHKAAEGIVKPLHSCSSVAGISFLLAQNSKKSFTYPQYRYIDINNYNYIYFSVKDKYTS